MISLQRRTFEGIVYQATVKEELRIGMRRQQGDEDVLVGEARMLLRDELKATEEAGMVAPDLKVTTFEVRMTGGVDAANKGFLLQRWQLEGEGVQQVGFQHAIASGYKCDSCLISLKVRYTRKGLGSVADEEVSKINLQIYFKLIAV